MYYTHNCVNTQSLHRYRVLFHDLASERSNYQPIYQQQYRLAEKGKLSIRGIKRLTFQVAFPFFCLEYVLYTN